MRAFLMTVPNPARQKAARATLDEIFTQSSSVWVVHYSCESFYDRPEGRSPRITSIAMRKLDSAQTVSFSIYKIAEINQVPFNDIEKHYDSLEREMLKQFYTHLKNFQDAKYLHWNMRDSNYGFQAIEHRFRVLGAKESDLHEVHDNSKTDLARLLIDIYGAGYTGHPRLETLLDKNHISRLDFLTGAQEAEAFEQKDFVALHQSTLRKVDVIANIAGRTRDGSLKTNTTWWNMHGGRVTTAGKWMAEHPLWLIGTGLATIAGLGLGAAVVCG